MRIAFPMIAATIPHLRTHWLLQLIPCCSFQLLQHLIDIFPVFFDIFRLHLFQDGPPS